MLSRFRKGSSRRSQDGGSGGVEHEKKETSPEKEKTGRRRKGSGNGSPSEGKRAGEAGERRSSGPVVVGGEIGSKASRLVVDDVRLLEPSITATLTDQDIERVVAELQDRLAVAEMEALQSRATMQRMREEASLQPASAAASMGHGGGVDTSVGISVAGDAAASDDGEFVNEYLLGRTLGAGAFGTVRLAVRDGNKYAVKVLRKSILKKKKWMGDRWEASGLKQVETEIAVMKKLEHPNVVKLVEVIDDDENDNMYLVMEYVENGAIRDTAIGDPIAPDVALRAIRDTVLGLEALHDQKIIHRDIKPDNLLVAAGGTVKISDFGVSQALASDDEWLSATAGSPAFLAPEVVSGKAFRGPPIDLWALGVTLFSLIYGRLPFSSPNVMVLYRKIRTQPVTFPAKPQMPESFHALLRRLLEKDPQKRATLADLKVDPWLTSNGAHPLPEPDHTPLVPTEAETAAALTPALRIRTIVVARQVMTRALIRARKSISERRASAAGVSEEVRAAGRELFNQSGA